MAKRKSRKEPILGGFTFNKIDPYGGVESSTVAESRLHIESIMPDPDQPRTLLPRDLYERLFTGQQRPLDVMAAWLERGAQADAPPALLQAIDGVRQLAATIEHRDLINPITVREASADDLTLPVGVQHIIVTGERRWWSHVLLTLEDRPINGDQHPDRIKATVVPQQNIRALQLIENVAREDLSVIEKAQGMIALREELASESDSKVTWGDVEEILGISRSYRTRILRVLNLSPEAQELVAQHNLAEKTIRPITEHLHASPELQMTALRQIIAWLAAGDEAVSHKRVAEFVQTLVSPVDGKRVSAEKSDASIWVAKFHQRISGTLKLLDSLDENTLSEAAGIIGTGHKSQREQLLRLREQIDRLLDS